MEIHGLPAMTKDEMLAEYEVLGFAYGLAVVKRKADQREGTLSYVAVSDEDGNLVRYYYDFVG